MTKTGRERIFWGAELGQIAFPLGGIGAGMFCIEGTGAIGSLSLRNAPDLFREPETFSTLWTRVDGTTCTRVIEGPVPRHKIFGRQGTLSGLGVRNSFGKTYGLPRFAESSFQGRFPFAKLAFSDPAIPLCVSLTAFSPFIPLQADDSSLPAATLRYRFENTGTKRVEAVYAFNTENFMAQPEEVWFPSPTPARREGCITQEEGCLVLSAEAGCPSLPGTCRIGLDAPDSCIDTDWYTGSWFDTLSMRWQAIRQGNVRVAARADGKSAGGSISAAFSLEPGEAREITVFFAWYVPDSSLRLGMETEEHSIETYRPWYAGRFSGADAVMTYYKEQHARLWEESELFSETLYTSTLPAPMLEALTANLSVLKSPTLLRQTDGRLWAWEGCCDTIGSCHGSCTHVWNYAQAIPHLFPALERTLRQTEFFDNQNDEGHQEFRASLPIRKAGNTFYAAADGQLGGIMKIYREWRISGDKAFLVAFWPRMKESLDYCIRTWDKRREGVLREPHHNTYDIEFWGADAMCSSFYLGALKAMARMARAVEQDGAPYETLYRKGRAYLETELFNGEYFFQRVEWETLDSRPEFSFAPNGEPKYQYGEGCLSDGVLGAWMAQVCGLGDILDPDKVKKHLLSVYRYNFKRDLRDHENPQRPGYALGDEGGLLLCTWPHGNRPMLPFVYSDEVWTGIEHQVAAHLLLLGCEKEAKEIAAVSRSRYDGIKRNPFDEYECGHWYARALASYAYLQAYAGVRYDAVEKTLCVEGKVREFCVFLCTATGYGIVVRQNGRTTLRVVRGRIDVQRIVE